MAAFGVMAALHERARSGEGQMVDVSMADGALSWLAMVAGRYFCDGEVPRRGEQQLAGGLICYLPYEAADGWVSCGALEPKFWAALCNGVERPGPDREAVRGARLGGLGAGRRDLPLPQPRRVARLQRRARLLHRAGPRPRRGARLGAGPRARDGGRAGAARARARSASSALPVKLSRTPADPTRPAPAFGEHTEEVLRRGRLLGGGGRGDAGVGRCRRRAASSRGVPA